MIALGPVASRVDINRVRTDLNDAQRVYEFVVYDSLLNLPVPTVARPDGRNLPPAYAPDALFEYVWTHRGTTRGTPPVLFGVIDTEVFDGLYSAIDRSNRMGVVSLCVDSLPDVLSASRKTREQYVELEVGAQLLAIQYRRRAGLSCDPGGCDKPWHIERRDCLFDYFGLTADDVQKLISPKLSDQVLAEFRAAEVPQRYIDASLAIVRKASTTLWSEVWSRLPADPVVTLSLGAILGLAAALIASAAGLLVVTCFGVAVALIGGRVAQLKRG